MSVWMVCSIAMEMGQKRVETVQTHVGNVTDTCWKRQGNRTEGRLKWDRNGSELDRNRTETWFKCNRNGRDPGRHRMEMGQKQNGNGTQMGGLANTGFLRIMQFQFHC